MTQEELKKYRKWSLGLVIALGSIFLLYLNILVPYLPGDDYIFQLKIPDEGIIGSWKINSLSDLWESQTNFYRNYHYRVLNHTLLQILLLLPSWVFDLLNVGVFLFLPICVLPSQHKKTTDYLAKYVFVLFFLWVFHFDLGRCYFLTTGSMNYTWLLVPQLLYIKHLLRYLREETYHSPWLVVLALLNFNSNENVQIVLFVLSLYVLFRTRKRTLLFSSLILLAGGVFMLLSPSIGERLAEQGFRSGGLIPHLQEYLKRAVFFSLRYWPLVLLVVLSARHKWQPSKEVSFVLLGSAALSIIVMLGIPLFEPRSAVFGFFLVLMWWAYSTEASMPLPLVSVMVLFGVLVSINRLPAFQQQRTRHNLNEKLLLSEETKVQLDPYCDQVQRSYLLCYPLSKDANFVDNRSLAAVYKKRSVQERPHTIPKYKLGDLKSDASGVFLYAKEKERLHLFIDTNQTQNNYYILRGARKRAHKHRLYNLIPPKWRLFFLDYLEDVTSNEQKVVTIDGQQYPYLTVQDYKLYQYVLVSAYEVELHNRVGEILKLDLTFLK